MATSFGQRLKAARVMAGLSMDALVAKMGQRVSKQAISKYENGLMSPDSAILIARLFSFRVRDSCRRDQLQEEGLFRQERDRVPQSQGEGRD